MRAAAALVAAVGLCAACSGTDTDTHVYRVPSSSMEPTLHCARPAIGCEAKTDDLVAVHPFGNRRPQRGEIVVFRTPALAKLKCGSGGIFIKRVVGLPGERWSERRGFIEVDGRELVEPYIQASRRDSQTLEGGAIPQDEFLLLGDNRASSCDSRVYGLVPRRNLIGWVFDIKRGSQEIHIR
jgi:signal peptidase I